MKTLLPFIFYIGLSILAGGCKNLPSTYVIKVDQFGNTYELVSLGNNNKDGTSQVEVWKRINPIDVDFLYTPMLRSQVFTNEVASFNLLEK